MNKDFSWISMNSAELNNLLIPLIPSLDTGTKFPKKTLTYAWMDSNNPARTIDLSPELHNGTPAVLEPLKHHRDVVNGTLGYLERVIDIDFQEVEQNSDLRLGISDLILGGYATLPSETLNSQVQFSNLWDKDIVAFGNIFPHEMAHNLGLGHSGESPAFPSKLDVYEFTTMSYNMGTASPEFYGVLDYAVLLSKYGPSKRTEGFNFNFRNDVFTGVPTYERADPVAFVNYQNYINIAGNDLDIVLGDGRELFTLIGTPGLDTINLTSLTSFESSTLTNLSAGIFSTTPSRNQGQYYDEILKQPVFFNYGPNISRPDIKFYEGLTGSGMDLERLTLTGHDDKVFLGSFFDEINTGKGNDEFIGFGQHQKLVGGEGMDLWSTGTSRSSTTANKTLAGNALSNSGKKIEFEGIERIQFTDSKIAFDLNGNAGKVAKIIGSVFGPSLVANKEYVGIGLGFLDSGTSYEQLIKIALDARFGKTPSNTELVKTLYTNVAGSPPSIQEERDFVNLLNDGTFNQTSLTFFATEHELNAQRIDLVGLTNNGIEYV